MRSSLQALPAEASSPHKAFGTILQLVEMSQGPCFHPVPQELIPKSTRSTFQTEDEAWVGVYF